MTELFAIDALIEIVLEGKDNSNHGFEKKGAVTQNAWSDKKVPILETLSYLFNRQCHIFLQQLPSSFCSHE
jgi:hypothetical protein